MTDRYRRGARLRALPAATRDYQSVLGKAGPLAALVDTNKLDLPNDVTERTLDGVYPAVADEERRIRANPAARSTELLKKVFGR